MSNSYGTREKKIVFNDTDKRHADLKIRLQHDDLSQSEFFRAMITGYIEKDSRIIDYLYEWRELNKGYSKAKRAKSERLLKKGEQVIRLIVLLIIHILKKSYLGPLKKI